MIREIIQQWAETHFTLIDGVALDDLARKLELYSETTSYVQPVPEHCDRIAWRGNYYYLPLISTTPDRAGGSA